MSAPVVVVTGGASGIGRATCAKLLAEGMSLAVLDLDGDAAKVAAGEGGLGVAADVSLEADVQRAFGAVFDTFGRVDVLVNNAGISGGPDVTLLHTTSVEDFDRVHGVNSRGVFLCSKAVIPSMIAQGGGHIITVASVASQIVFPGRVAYNASKGAALMLARSIAVDYAAHGIRSNAVCPGFVETPLTQWRLDIPELRKQIESWIPLDRVAQPDDIADAIAVLASGRMSYMTGHALIVDGGWTAQ
jgi:NAD(P)-dependent dehydrogenase (short-subunit alcohol dehydrogenase family)